MYIYVCFIHDDIAVYYPNASILRTIWGQSSVTYYQREKTLERKKEFAVGNYKVYP